MGIQANVYALETDVTSLATEVQQGRSQFIAHSTVVMNETEDLERYKIRTKNIRQVYESQEDDLRKAFEQLASDIGKKMSTNIELTDQ